MKEIAGGLLVLMLFPAWSQQTLTLSDVVGMALERNGNVRAALKAVESAQARLQIAQSRFFPTITPNFNYTHSSTSALGNGAVLTKEQRRFDLSTRWLLFDTGQRGLAFQQSKRSLEATRQNTRDTIRQIIFQTSRAYYEVLRRRELLKVAEASVERAKALYELARYQADPKIGTAPAKDLFQAEADLANSEVQLIAARNNLALAVAELKRIIGWEATQSLPELASAPEPAPAAERPTLARYWEEAFRQRPDLQAAQLEVQIARLGVQSARIETGPTFQLNLNAAHQFEPQRQDQRLLTFGASYPLFDAGLVRANLKEAQTAYESAQFRLEQSKRDAMAEVEAAYLTLTETERRLEASRKAVQAARKNYEAARESLSEGVGTIIEVITAQLALITAETNFVQAIYDYYIGELQLKLAVGEPLPNEEKAL